jgi:hypothetical protein
VARPDEAARTEFERYVRERADDLGLRDWDISVEYAEEPNDSELARVVRTYGRRAAIVTFVDSFWDESPDERRCVVIHELVHCHLDGPASVVRDMGQQLGHFVQSVLMDNHVREIELATDAIAEAIAPLYPPVPGAEPG